MAVNRNDGSLSERIAALSPEKQALLRARLADLGGPKESHELLHPTDAGTPAGLSEGQHGIWLAERIRPCLAFNLLFSLRLIGVLNVEALRESLAHVVERHEILRSTFDVAGGEPVQIVQPPGNVVLHVADLRDLPADVRESEVRTRGVEESRVPFDLVRGPLIRWRLLRLEAELSLLLIPVHHLIFDDWSIGIVASELSESYAAYSHGRRPHLHPLKIQFADFARWQRSQMRGPSYEDGASYWREKLGGKPSPLNLPTDRRGPRRHTHHAERVAATIDPRLLNSLKHLCNQHGATLFAVLLAAFKVLLARISGQTDIIVATSLIDRERPETAPLIGFFLKILVLRTDLAGDPNFAEALRRVRETTVGAILHADVPYSKIVADLNPRRDRNGTELFRVQLQLLPKPDDIFHCQALRIEYAELECGTATTDLDVMAWETHEGLRVAFQYNVALFDQSTIRRLLDSFRVLLAGIAAKPEEPISSLSLVPNHERRRLLIELNDTEHGLQPEILPRQFDLQTARTPDAIALAEDGHCLSYRELEERANRLSRALRTRGVVTGSRVAICLERSADYVISLLAVLKAGAAFVPLDPHYPRGRLSFMLGDAMPILVITRAAFEDHVDLPMGVGVFVLERERRFVEHHENKSLPYDAADAAYVIYTSGSTGAPNGVLAAHSGTLNRFSWLWCELPFGADDVACARISPSFVDHVWELLGPLLAGAPVVLVGHSEAHDPVALTRLLADHGVSRLTVVPSLLDSMLSSVPDLSARLAALRVVISSGEQLSLEIAQRFHTALPGRTLLNLYGSSEVSADVTAHVIGPDEATATPPIGRPIWNTRVYVLDPHQELLPAGVTGEIYVSGLGLAQGYLNRPDLTAARFIPHPFIRELGLNRGARAYRTGDLGRWRSDGALEYVGRTDHQVKVRGYRVELQEIEAVLQSHPEVARAAVAPFDAAPDDRRLVAYVVLESDASVEPDALRKYASLVLPEYMVPSTVARVSELPLSANGKVDRRALMPPNEERSPERSGHPRNGLEQELTQLWETVLRTHPIATTESFFELGGSSLLAVRLFVEIEKRFGRCLPVMTLFQAPTIQSLASVIGTHARTEPSSCLIPIQPHGANRPLFLVPAHGGQLLNFRRLSHHLGPEQPLYGFQARGIDGKEDPHTTIEAMAADYIQELRAAQPEGPYSIGGHCFGATVAFEMAQQLVAEGAHIANLILLDALPRAGFFPRSFGYYFRRSVYHLGRRPVLLAEYIKDRIRLEKMRRGMASRLRFESRVINAAARAERAALSAASIYSPRQYAGDITCIWSDELAHLPEFEIAWRQLCVGKVDSYQVPGTQLTLFDEPQIRALAMKVRDCMAPKHLGAKTSRRT